MMLEQPGRDMSRSDENEVLPALINHGLNQSEEMYASLYEDLSRIHHVTAGLRGFLKELKEQGVADSAITQIEYLIDLSKEEADIFQKSINITKPVRTSEDDRLSSDEVEISPTMETKPGHEDNYEALSERMVRVRDQFSGIVTLLLEGDNQALAVGLERVFDEVSAPTDISEN